MSKNGPPSDLDDKKNVYIWYI